MIDISDVLFREMKNQLVGLIEKQISSQHLILLAKAGSLVKASPKEFKDEEFDKYRDRLEKLQEYIDKF